jgi:hypothetical protein
MGGSTKVLDINIFGVNTKFLYEFILIQFGYSMTININ